MPIFLALILWVGAALGTLSLICAPLPALARQSLSFVPVHNLPLAEDLKASDIGRLQFHLTKAIKICGGSIEASQVFKQHGIEISTDEMQKFLQPKLPLATAKTLYPRVKKILNRPWPLSQQSLKIRNLSTARTTWLTVHRVATDYRSPFLKTLRQHLTLLIRRYNSLQEFAHRHSIDPLRIVEFLDPHFIPEANLLKRIFKIFHAENYREIKENQTSVSDATKSLTEFSSRSLKIPLNPSANSPVPYTAPEASNSTQNQDPSYITISLNNIEHIRNNVRPIMRYLIHITEKFKGRKNFSLIMSQHYTFNNENLSPFELRERIRHMIQRYLKPPPTQQPRVPMIYFLFDLIEQAEHHLNQKSGLQAPKLVSTHEVELVVQLPEHQLKLKSSDIQNISTEKILALTHYYRYLAFNVYKGARNMAKLHHFNIDLLQRYLNPNLTAKMTPRSLNTMLTNVVQAHNMAQDTAQLKQKLQSLMPASTPSTPHIKLKVPTNAGVQELSLENLEHLWAHQSDVQHYLRQIAQHFGGQHHMVNLMRLAHQSSMTERTLDRFLHRTTNATPAMYTRIFEFINKALAYTKKSPDEIQHILEQLRQHQEAHSVSFVFRNQNYNFNIQQGKENIEIMQQYLKQKTQELTNGRTVLLARKLKIGDSVLQSDIRPLRNPTAPPRANRIKRMFYIIQQVQKISSPKPAAHKLAANSKTPKPRAKRGARAVEPLDSRLEFESPLHQAVRSANIQHLRQAIQEHAVELNAVDPRTQETPLHWAAFSGNAQAVQLLLEAGASMQPVQDLWPIEEAVRSSNLETLKTFVRYGAPLDISHNGSNLFDIALARQHFLKQKIKQGYPLYQPEHEQATEVLEFLKQQGLKPLYYATHELPTEATDRKKQSPHAPASSPLAATQSVAPHTDNSDLKKALKEFQKFYSTWAGLPPPFDEEARLFHQLNQELAKVQAQSPTCFELLDNGRE